MKPTPRSDFLVGVWPESADHPSPVNAMYEGIYSVTLNHSVSFMFVPPVDRRAPGTPALPADVDDVRTPDEARRTVIALSSLVVTPDDARAATIETSISGDDRRCVTFYVTLDEFHELEGELRNFSERLPGVHDAVPVSEIADTRLARFLLTRALPSDQLSARALHMLGRS
jgi:hypothetical protein